MVVTMKQTAKATEATYMRKATLEDLDRIWEIVEDARALLKADGSEQWQNGYPTRLTFQQDIEFGNCYLVIAGDRIAGTVTLMPRATPTITTSLTGNGRCLVTRLRPFTGSPLTRLTAAVTSPTTSCRR
ncbi:hypothetical protein QPX96_02080 [Limosilactobacillus fermentum]|nr:hypothetical protein [Limosilactobacillus fermentum]